MVYLPLGLYLAETDKITNSREYLASYPHGVIAFRLSANVTGKLDVKLSLSRAKWVLSQAASISRNNSAGHVVSLSAYSGQDQDAISFWSETRIVNSGGMDMIAYKSTAVHRLNSL